MKSFGITKKRMREVVEKYNIGKLLEITPIKTSGNVSFFIKTSLDIYFLRLCGDNYRWRSKQEIVGELRLIDFLKKNNFSVISYEKMKNGDSVVNLGRRYGYLRRFSTGKQIKTNPTGEQLLKVGQALGRYHNVVNNYRSGNLRKNINFGVEETLKYFNKEKKSILKSNLKNKKQFVENFENEIKKIKLPKNLAKGMIHEDLGKRHVLWKKNKITAFIDFDRSYFGYLILDLGQTLRGWCFVDNWQKWSKNNYKYFLRGYESERKLTKAEKKYLLPAIKFAVLERSLSFATSYTYNSKAEKLDGKFARDSLFKQIKKIKI